MRNQRSNFIPVPTKPAKNVPKPLPRVLAQRKSCSCQTERVVLIKEENLSFHSYTRLGQNDGGMQRDYVKAINYINSCHKFINCIVEKNNTDNKKNTFQLPMITNFLPIFPHLIGKKAARNKDKPLEKILEKKSPQSEDRKCKSNFGVKKVPETAPIDPVPVGDCGKNIQEIQEDKYANQVADIVKGEIQQFLSNLQEDMNKAVKKTRSETPKQKCKNLDIVKQRLEELSKICFLQKNIESNSHIVQNVKTPSHPPSPPPINTSEECSVIMSDTDCEELKNKESRAVPALRITCYGESATSLISESSDIRTDSENEIKL